MSGSILVKELGRHIHEPDPPGYYSRPAMAAWRRGFIARCWRAHAISPYSKPWMTKAWVAGYDAAATIIRAEFGDVTEIK